MKVCIESNGNEVKIFSSTTGLSKRRLQKNTNNRSMLIKVHNVQENFMHHDIKGNVLIRWSYCIEYFLHSLNQF